MEILSLCLNLLTIEKNLIGSTLAKNWEWERNISLVKFLM